MLPRPVALIAALALLLLPSLQPACAAALPGSEQQAPQVAVTRHVGRFGGQSVPYTATVREIVLPGPSGAPAATVVTIAYARDKVADLARRPVLFVFNGGPGASSVFLHGAIGPIRRATPGTGLAALEDTTWIANPYSPLDTADLVFIDPVNTGFSRSAPGADPKVFYSIKGDALAVRGVIAEWLKANGRERSPRYLAGESYGTTRAVAILKEAPDLDVDGVLLVAAAAIAPGREMPFVASLPTMAVGAAYHGKIDRAGRTSGQVYDQALEFARTTYVGALIKGSSLPPAERRRVAEQMSAFIGLPADLIEAENLRISQNVYMFNLLKDRGLRTGLLDVRVTAPLEPGQVGDIDDPALGVAPKRAAGASAGPPPSPASIGPVQSPAMARYLREQLKYVTAEPYYGINFTANSQWDYTGMEASLTGLGAAMKARPGLRLFWAAGHYDLATPPYVARYTFDQDGVPADRLEAIYFEGPHGVYDGEANLAAFNAAVRRFLARSAGSPPR